MTASERGRPAAGPIHARVLADRYRLDRVLGRGAMGTVWAAFDQLLHRRVAIKEINFPSGMPEEEAHMLAERTLREARAIAQLSHPNVITLYDILTVGGAPVIVMEVLAARSLGDVLRENGSLTPGQTATVGASVASGLAAAHAAGITHRDVKPGNVLISADGRIKLTDFGIARSQSENPMTATGLLLGSPAYISPEVATGQTASPAADAWGLGALLFACVEGRPPYDRGNPIATLMSVVSDPVPPVRRGGPLIPIINDLLVKSPAHRMTVQQARSQLVKFADDPTEGRLRIPGAVQSARPSVPQNFAPGGGVGAGAGVGAGGGPAPVPGAVPGSHRGSGSLPGSGPGSVPGSHPGSGSVPGSGPGAGSVPSAVPGAGPGTHSGLGSVPGAHAGGSLAASQTGHRPPPRPSPALSSAGLSSAGLSSAGLSSSALSSPSRTDLPPPPWAATGGAHLAALPAASAPLPRPAPSTAVLEPQDRVRRAMIAVGVGVVAAVAGYFGVHAVIEWAQQLG